MSIARYWYVVHVQCARTVNLKLNQPKKSSITFKSILQKLSSTFAERYMMMDTTIISKWIQKTLAQKQNAIWKKTRDMLRTRVSFRL